MKLARKCNSDLDLQQSRHTCRVKQWHAIMAWRTADLVFQEMHAVYILPRSRTTTVCKCVVFVVLSVATASLQVAFLQR
jgi:hypothetical protein